MGAASREGRSRTLAAAMGDEIGEEIVDQPSAIFDTLDVNGDGSLNSMELCTRLGDFGFTDDEVEAIFIGIDVDGDGSITKEEFLKGFAKFCGKVDDYFIDMLAGEDQFEAE